jgi:transposase
MSEAKRYPRELHDRAVRMVFEVRGQSGLDKGAVARVAAQLGVGRETLRTWVRQAEIDSGKRAGTTTRMRSGSRSWNGKCASCAARMRY